MAVLFVLDPDLASIRIDPKLAERLPQFLATAIIVCFAQYGLELVDQPLDERIQACDQTLDVGCSVRTALLLQPCEVVLRLSQSNGEGTRGAQRPRCDRVREVRDLAFCGADLRLVAEYGPRDTVAVWQPSGLVLRFGNSG
jgi:hypothetical protein